MKNKVVFEERGYRIEFLKRDDGFWIRFVLPSKSEAVVNLLTRTEGSFIDGVVAECIEKGPFGD